MRTLVFAYARMNPPTIGHELLVNKLLRVAFEERGSYMLILSHSQDPIRNPLSQTEKRYYAQLAFPGVRMVNSTPEMPSFLKFLENESAKYDRVIMVAGSDRMDHYRSVLNQYNGKDYHFDQIEVVSAGERDPDSDDVAGMSASKLRRAAKLNDLEEFTKGCPLHWTEADCESLFHAVRRGQRME